MENYSIRLEFGSRIKHFQMVEPAGEGDDILVGKNQVGPG